MKSISTKILFFLGAVIVLLLVAGRFWQQGRQTETASTVQGDVVDTGEPQKPEAGGDTGNNTKKDQQEKISDSRRNTIVRATETISPAVVSISVTRARRVRRGNPFFDDPFFDYFFFGESTPMRESLSSIGSGVLVNKKGYIVTNGHVLQNQPGETRLDIVVRLSDGREFKAKVVGIDDQNDIAVIRIEGKNLPVARLQKDSENLIGEWVVAIGNPFGYLMSDLKPTVTVGVISAVGRNFTPSSGIGYYNMIQTDASINPGNSGGALVNALGEVIGINTFILTGQRSQSGSIGIGFAIPVHKAMRVVNELITYGYIRQWTTGIYTNAYLQSNYRRINGILVSAIQRGSPGDKAGLREGDVIYAVAGRGISNLHEFLEVLRRFQVGETVEIKYRRGTKQLKTKMVLEERKTE